MARRSKKDDQAIAVVAIIGVAAIYSFYMANKELINLILIIVGSILVIGILTFITIKLVRHNKRVDAYQETPYYVETKLPYKVMKSSKGKEFEVQVFNSIHAVMGKQAQLLTNLSMPQADALNIVSQIDLVLLHPTGFYVIEVKDYAGPLIGRVDEAIWTPKLLVKTKAKHGKRAETSYETNWGLLKKFQQTGHSNPIQQNEVHIRTLKSLVNEDYKNIVIFSDQMFTDLPDPTKRPQVPVYSLGQFVDMLSNLPAKYSLAEIERLTAALRGFNRSSEKNDKLHISRLKSR